MLCFGNDFLNVDLGFLSIDLKGMEQDPSKSRYREPGTAWCTSR